MTYAQPQFDVFLAHNSQDKPQVREIANQLERRGLKPWLDEEEIQPGRLFQDEIQRAISQCKSAIIFFGLQGLGSWQTWELKVLIKQCVEKNIPVIPVLLPDVPELPKDKDLLFLEQIRWVSFSDGINDENALYLLEWGITGQKPEKILENEKPGKIPTEELLQTISSSTNEVFQEGSSTQNSTSCVDPSQSPPDVVGTNPATPQPSLKIPSINPGNPELKAILKKLVTNRTVFIVIILIILMIISFMTISNVSPWKIFAREPNSHDFLKRVEEPIKNHDSLERVEEPINNHDSLKRVEEPIKNHDSLERGEEPIKNNDDTSFNISSRYSELERLLKDEKFEEADKETLKLIRSLAYEKNRKMLQAKDIPTFDCNALLTIDKLWKSTKVNQTTMFGFSVQSTIWDDEVKKGIVSGVDNDAKVYDIFANRVGWIVNKTRIKCDYSNRNKPGNVPCLINCDINFGPKHFAQRLKDCTTR